MRRTRIRIKNHEVATTAPSENFTRQKIFDLVRISFRGADPKVFNRNAGMSTLGIVWIKSHQDQNDIVESLRGLGIKQYLFILNHMKSKILVLAQSAIMAPNLV